MGPLLPLTVGDVHRPGDERYAEAASPSLPPRGQAGDTCWCRIRAALHPRHGRHRHLLHRFTKRSVQDTGERHCKLWLHAVNRHKSTLGSCELHTEHLVTNMKLLNNVVYFIMVCETLSSASRTLFLSKWSWLGSITGHTLLHTLLPKVKNVFSCSNS